MPMRRKKRKMIIRKRMMQPEPEPKEEAGRFGDLFG
jgi:hypothetical protein